MIAVGALLAGACRNATDDLTLADGPKDEIIAGIRETLDGVFTDDELVCLGDELTANDEVTIGEIMAFVEDGVPNGAVFDLYREAIRLCHDPDAELPVMVPTGVQRDAFVQGLEASGVQFTDDQLDCFLESMVDRGFGLREMMIFGYLGRRDDPIVAAMTEVFQDCGVGA